MPETEDYFLTAPTTLGSVKVKKPEESDLEVRFLRH